MTILTGILNAIGLMTRAEHEELTRLKTAALDTIAQSYCGEVKAATDWEAKFKTAIGNLAVASTDLADLRATFNQRVADAVQDYQTDDQKWRNSLKRSRDRKAAKNRGGGK